MMEAMATEAPIGTRIRRARERLRMTQADLGAAVGKSVRTVNDWENDRTYPRNSIGALEQVLGTHLTDEPEPEPDGGGGTSGPVPTMEEVRAAMRVLERALGRVQPPEEDGLAC